MTRRTAAWSVAALVLLSPASASAFAWTLRTGAEYLQDDSWDATGARATSPRLDVDLGLDAGGSIGGPGVVDWGGGVGYRRTASSQSSIDDVRERLSYRLRSTLFSAAASRFTVSGNAARIEDDFSTEGAAAGSLLSNVYGGDFWLRPGQDRPWLRGGYTYTSTAQDTFALGQTDRSIHTLSASAGHGTPAFSYAANYRGNFSDGTFEGDRYDDHRVDLDADATVNRSLKVRMTDAYYLRLPRAEGSALNPRQELTSFSAMLDHRGGGANALVGGYQYTHGVQSGLPRLADPADPAAAPAPLDQERTLHRLGYGLIRVLPNAEWKIRGTADATLNEERAGETIARNYGQSVGAIVFWRTSDRAGSLELRGGPRVGALEPATGDPLFGYGGSAGATLSREGAVKWQLNYDVRYARDLDGAPGWSLQQHVLAQGDGRLGAGYLGASLQASGDRRESPPGTLGLVSTSNATRTLLATLRYRLRSSDAQLQAGLQDGTVGALSGGEGDGLFLAPAFDSHSRFVAISASTALARYLTARVRLRTQTIDLPDRPTVDEAEAFGSIEWAYGALRFALEDRYVVSSVRDGTLKVNQVLVRAYRVFGSRF